MISLAWHQLTREKLRFLIGTLGVAFGVVLMFMQFGFQTALFDSAALLQSTLNGEIVLIDPKSSSLVSMTPFTERRLYQALGSKNVESVSPVYVGFAGCRSDYAPGTRRIFVVAFKPEEKVFNNEGVERNRNRLRVEDSVLFDRLSRKEFGPVALDFKNKQAGNAKEITTSPKLVSLQVGNHTINVAGLFSLGTSFGADGNIFTSDVTFFRMGFQHTRKPGLIDIGVVHLKKGSNAHLTQSELRQALPKDVSILTRDDFINLEKIYWRQSTAIGFIFSMGVVLGLVVGAVIVYQILYSDVNDHLSEYATLKAMGYSNGYLSDVVLQEAIILAAVGFGPGLAASFFLYQLTRDVTGLPMYMQSESAMFVLALSVVMCCASALLASSRLKTADPADCF